MSDNEEPGAWRVSSFSGGGDCVEWKVGGGIVEVRDSKNSSSASLVFTRSEWLAFVDGVKAGEADLT
jgi:hypothetical protein